MTIEEYIENLKTSWTHYRKACYTYLGVGVAVGLFVAWLL